MTRENFRVHTGGKSIDKTHRGILSTYTSHERIKGYELESKSTDNKSRGYNSPKAFVTGEELIRF